MRKMKESIAFQGFLLGTLIFMFCLGLNLPATRSAHVEEEAADKVVAISKGFVGSKSCRSCHEKFYTLWSDSHHGTAMQPFTVEFARKELQPQKADILIDQYRYKTEISKGYIREKGPQGEKEYKIEHAMGGKNIYYFLTLLDRGRLQVLPVAYDVRKKEWYDTMDSMISHLADLQNRKIDWRDPAMTFNITCYSCHVSQLSTNYDLKTNTYHTVWAEPGINCETCHGPAGEHVRVCADAPKGTIPPDLKIIVTKKMTKAQRNDMCAPCHAKMSPLTLTFKPGDRYFDHYDLVGLENTDFYPDGRDFGENFTMTTWRMSPCARSGQIDCMHCHTSSGRYRFSDPKKANNACLPCHQNKVKNPIVHTFHREGSSGNRCISCHMPKTELARMIRSDHSMRPPMPAATMKFKSPNACNLCHSDQTVAWADGYVRKWRKRDYQAPTLKKAELVEAARRREWGRLPEILSYLESKDRDEIYTASLIRLLLSCSDPMMFPVLVNTLKDTSPLVRAAAVDVLGQHPVPELAPALMALAGDEYRLVRIHVAAALAAVPSEGYGNRKEEIQVAFREFEESMKSRPDDWASHFNYGNYLMNRGEFEEALTSFQTALKLDPRRVMPMLNLSILYNQLGDKKNAEDILRKALEVEPENTAVNFNLGLLLAQSGQAESAEACFKKVLVCDKNMAAAAYNLGILLANERTDEALQYLLQAVRLAPGEPEYFYAFAFYLDQNGDSESACRELREYIKLAPVHPKVYRLLGKIYEKQGKTFEAKTIYQQAMDNNKLPECDRQYFRSLIQEAPKRE
jgi:Flp pilus assembly protein TadD